MPGGWETVRLDEIEPIPVVEGTLLWRPVRRTLDIGAFGINAYVAPNAGDDVVEEHTETSLGHEELYLVLAGRAPSRPCPRGRGQDAGVGAHPAQMVRELFAIMECRAADLR